MPAFLNTDIGRKYFFGRRYMGVGNPSVPISLPPGNTSKEKYRASVFEVNVANLENPVPPVDSVKDTYKYSGVRYGIKGGNYLQFGIGSGLEGGTGTGTYHAYVVWAVFNQSGGMLSRKIIGSVVDAEKWVDAISKIKRRAMWLLFVYNTQASTEYGATCSTAAYTTSNGAGYDERLQQMFDNMISGRTYSGVEETFGIPLSDDIARVFSGG